MYPKRKTRLLTSLTRCKDYVFGGRALGSPFLQGTDVIDPVPKSMHHILQLIGSDLGKLSVASERLRHKKECLRTMEYTVFQRLSSMLELQVLILIKQPCADDHS